ncbi:MAG: membrane protein insertase YidC [Beijerinckiaceae bacterium]|nr:membrane protein insertase YidC [Beijerinckiaceae bacterium]
MSQDIKNVIIATCLSLVVVLAWDRFYAAPQFEKQRQIQAEMQARQTPAAQPGEQQAGSSQSGAPQAGNAGSNLAQASRPGAPASSLSAAPRKSREEALAESPRIKIEAPSIYGSIALKGARIDDVSLKDYRETVDPKSPNIILLSPLGSPSAYYTESGFIPEPGNSSVLPGPDTLWQADRETLTETAPVTLTYDNGGGLVFRRKIAVDDRYMFTVTDSVENKSAQPVTLHPYAFVKRHGKPESAGYSVLHEGFVGVIGVDTGVQQIAYDKIEKEEHATKSFAGTRGWLGLTDKYWAATVIPDQSKAVEASFSGSGGAPMMYQAGFVGTEGRTIAPGSSAEFTAKTFAGAKETDTLDNYQNNLGIEKFDLLIDWGWFYFLTKPMFRLLDFIYKFVGNFGIAILIITVLVKGVFFPLANKSYVAMAKMKTLQPQILAIKDRFPEDKQKQQMEVMALYKREKLNPLSGCLPLLIQIPVFFALYKVLVITIEMRQAPFFGWIKDLSRPDPTNVFNLFGLLPIDPTQVPVFGPYLAIGIWPLIMGITMFIQMKMNPEPADPMQKQVFTWMPVMFTFMLGSFASGLIIYWTWNNILSVIQQAAIMKKAGVKIELWDNLTGMFRKKATT